MSQPAAAHRAGLRHGARRAGGHDVAARALAAFTALACAGLGLFIAGHHPVSGVLAVLAVLGLAALAAFTRRGWLVALPALLPLANLMPWTGWLVADEFDLVVLALAAGGYARWAWRGAAAGPASSATARAPLLAALLVAAYAALQLLAIHRGAVHAGGWSWGWWQLMHEPLHALRAGKPFLLVLLVAPLWRRAVRADADGAEADLARGLVAGLAVASLLVLLERLAFPGLLNFSSDYRTVGWFWEMHVGGATLDGFLALTTPFAVWAWLRARHPLGMVAAGAASLLGAYVVLTTFSRGLYLGLALGLALMAAQAAWQARATRRLAPNAGGASAWDWLVAAFFVAGFVAALAFLFPASGWRGLLGALGLAALMPAAGGWRGLGREGPRAVAIAGVAALLGLGLAAASPLLPKGPYVVYALLWLAAAAALWRGPGGAALHAGLMLGLVGAFVAVCEFWSEAKGFSGRALPMAALALAAAAVQGLRPPRAAAAPARRPDAWRARATTVAALAVAAMVVGGARGGAYIGDRMSTVDRDWQTRLLHWDEGLAQLDGTGEWLLGKGAGTYPLSHFVAAELKEQTGDMRLHQDGFESHVRLSGGKHVLDGGEYLRLSQRVARPEGPVVVTMKVRAPTGSRLSVEVCAKHLLYDDGCLSGGQRFPRGEGWQPMQFVLKGDPLSAWRGVAPRFMTFSIAVSARGTALEIDELRAVDAQGRELLRNGDFSDGLAGWYFSSDRHHMPWHMKNLGLHLLFENGVLGLALASLLTVAALWHLVAGGAARHPLAPPLAAALVAFLVVGLFDSLVDAPRLAFIAWALLLVALRLRPVPAAGAGGA